MNWRLLERLGASRESFVLRTCVRLPRPRSPLCVPARPPWGYVGYAEQSVAGGLVEVDACPDCRCV